MNSAAFAAAHKVSPGDFTRKRKLSLPTVMGFLLQLVGGQALQGRMAGILVATCVVLVVPRLVVPAGFQFDDWRLDAVFMAIWAAVSAVCAYGLGRRPLRFAAVWQDLN